ARLREIEAEAARLREELAASGASCRDLADRLAAAEALAGELDAVRAGREGLAGQRQEDARRGEALRARVGELERAHAEAAGAHDALARSHEEASGRWKAERQELHRLWGEKYRAMALQAEEHRRAEQARASAQLREQEAARREAEQRFRGELGRLAEQVRGLQGEGAALQAALQQTRRELGVGAIDHAVALRDAQRARQEAAPLVEQVQALQAALDELSGRDDTVRQKALEAVCARAELAMLGPDYEQ